MAIDLSRKEEFAAAWAELAEDLPAGLELKTDASLRLYTLAKKSSA